MYESLSLFLNSEHQSIKGEQYNSLYPGFKDESIGLKLLAIKGSFIKQSGANCICS